MRIDRSRAPTNAQHVHEAHTTGATRRVTVTRGTAVSVEFLAVQPSATQYIHSAATVPAAAVQRARPATRAYSASEWVQRNQAKLRPYRGKWVAVSSSGLVGHSTDFDEVFVEARRRGVDNPLVFKVPTPGRRKVVSVRR